MVLYYSMSKTKNPRESRSYKSLLKDRGEEFAELSISPNDEVKSYISWWQNNYNTENDEIKNLGLEPEYFKSLREAKKYLKEIEGN